MLGNLGTTTRAIARHDLQVTKFVSQQVIKKYIIHER